MATTIRIGKLTANAEVQQTIHDIVERLAKEYQPSRIVLFGSYAHGHSDHDSDIDLLIIKDTQDRPIDRRVAASRVISDPKRLIPLELLVLTPHEVEERLKVNDQFLKEILEGGKLLYEA